MDPSPGKAAPISLLISTLAGLRQHSPSVPCQPSCRQNSLGLSLAVAVAPGSDIALSCFFSDIDTNHPGTPLKLPRVIASNPQPLEQRQTLGQDPQAFSV